MQTSVLIIQADIDPQDGVENPTPNQIYKNVRMAIEERELKELAYNEVRIKMCFVGICGTDVHLTTNHPLTDYIQCSAPLSIPLEGRVIGHEGVGKIIGVGSHVKNLAEGMYVALESIIVCNQCAVCKRGKFNQCLNAQLVGLEKDGLLGTIVDVPASIAHNITDYMDNEQDLIAAANIEPAAVAYVGCINAEIKAGEKVAVFGAGPIGILTAMLSKLVFGASEVYMVEPNAFRRNFAKPWADQVYDLDEFFEKAPDDIDVVIEASAVLDNVTRVFRNINANGRVILLGRKGVSLDIKHVDHMITNEIMIKGSRGHLGGAFHHIMKLHKSGRINLMDIVTSTVDGIDEGMRLLNNPRIIEGENCKVMINLMNS